MNETLKILENRRSCRSFKPDMISEDELNAVIQKLLKNLGIEGNFEGIAHCALG